MACVSASIPKLPIPDALLQFVAPSISLPTIPGLDLCCNFWSPLPLPSIPIPIGGALGLLAAGLAAIIAVIQLAITSINSIINYINEHSFSCPLD